MHAKFFEENSKIASHNIVSVGAFTLAPPVVVHAQQQQGIFSPASTGIQSPVQILGKFT